MNPDIKEKWVAALRSGEYTQGHGKLYNPPENTYCCLGVLCDLYAKEKDIAAEGVFQKQSFDEDGETEGHNVYPPPEVVTWADLGCCDPVVTFDLRLKTVSSLNDSDESFVRIVMLSRRSL